MGVAMQIGFDPPIALYELFESCATLQRMPGVAVVEERIVIQ